MKKYTSIAQSRIRSSWLLLVSVYLFVTLRSPVFAATTWTQPDPTTAAGTAGASGLWAGVTAVYLFIYGVIWLIAAIIMARGWFKFKDGDQAAALYHLGGATGLALVPLFFQWIRAF